MNHNNKPFPFPLQWIELSHSNLTHNIEVIRNYLPPKTQIAALLKANAYGHGILPMCSLFAKAGINTFLVHSFEEAMDIKSSFSEQKIIIIGPLSSDQLREAVKQKMEITVYSQEHLDNLKLLNSKLSPQIHVKIETGTYRQGLEFSKTPAFINELKKLKSIILKGISSHFANIEDTSDTTYYKKQLTTFKKAIDLFIKAGFNDFTIHTACSAAIFLYPETHFQMVRPGISSYGYYSSPELAFGLKSKSLSPVLSWKTRIAQIKNISKGERIGYGLTYQTTRKTRLGILPIGYSDGYDRKLSNLGSCLVRGKRAYIRGRVCMNMTMIDLTDIPEAKPGDIVTLVGNDGTESVTADDIASLTGTISYEVLARLNPKICRIIVP